MIEYSKNTKNTFTLLPSGLISYLKMVLADTKEIKKFKIFEIFMNE